VVGTDFDLDFVHIVPERGEGRKAAGTGRWRGVATDRCGPG
jgi:hypothetical protein